MADKVKRPKPMGSQGLLDTAYTKGAEAYMNSLESKLEKQKEWNDRLDAELDKGDSWAWIRGKFEKCRTQFKWYTPREDSLKGTRYEVMGWIHVLFAHADPKVYIDITMEHQKRTDEAEASLEAIKSLHADIIDQGRKVQIAASGESKYGAMSAGEYIEWVAKMLEGR